MSPIRSRCGYTFCENLEKAERSLPCRLASYVRSRPDEPSLSTISPKSPSWLTYPDPPETRRPSADSTDHPVTECDRPVADLSARLPILGPRAGLGRRPWPGAAPNYRPGVAPPPGESAEFGPTGPPAWVVLRSDLWLGRTGSALYWGSGPRMGYIYGPAVITSITLP